MWTKQQVESWARSNQHQYQSIELPYDFNTRTFAEKGARDSVVKEKIEFMKWPDLKNKSFLDVGCNIGAFCFDAFKRGASRVIGVDANPNRVICAQTIAEMWGYDRNKIQFVHSKVENIKNVLGVKPIFDVVTCLSLYHHLDNVFNPIKDLSLLVKPKGYLYFETPCIDMETDRDIIILKFKKDKAVRFYPTPNTMKRLLEARFDKVTYMGIRQDPRSKKHMFLAEK